MSKKNKRDRGQNPRDAASDLGAPPMSEADAQAAAEHRARQKQEWAERKKARDRKPLPIAMYAWSAAGVGTVAAVVVGAVLLLSGGSDSTPSATATPDSRVEGLPIAQTVEIEAGDQGQATGTYFDPSTITGAAGEVIEIKVKNVGSVAHNLRVSGEDKEYETRDDFLSNPGTIRAGDEATVLVKIDTPGTYPFQCDFHPTQQMGNLVIS